MSIFGVDQMYAQLAQNAPIKSHLYEVRIIGGNGQVADAAESITLNCAAINVPGVTIGYTSDMRHGVGIQKQYPSSKNYTELNLTFYETEGEKERKFFLDWMDTVFNKKTHRFNYYNNIVKSVIIIQYDLQGNRTYECELRECFPSNISQLDKAYAPSGQVPTFSVNMQFYEMDEYFYDKQRGRNPFNVSDIIGSIF